MPKKNDQKQPPAEPSIDIRTPGLVEAFDSVGAMQAWELLRRSGTPLTAAELARIARMPVRTVQRALDRFEAVKLVRRHPGRKANPAVRWSVTRQTIQVHHRQLDPLDESLFAKMVTVFGTDSENEILRGVKDPNTYGVGDNHWQSINAASLDNDEMREL
jgi:DNA-binding MarR family transcriptional regulator